MKEGRLGASVESCGGKVRGGIGSRLLGFFLLAVAAVDGIANTMAINAATAKPRWPGELDLLRRYPWLSVAALTALGLIVLAAQSWRDRRGARMSQSPPLPPRRRVPDWVVQRAETSAAVEALCSKSGSAVAITTALQGTGGFGKTTLANLVCDSRRVRKHFHNRIYFISLGRDVRGRAAIAAKVAEATRFITGDTTTFDDPELAGAHLGRLLDLRLRTLLVIDDVWEREQLEPFLLGGTKCSRLVTTRISDSLPGNAHRIVVDEMTLEEARQLLLWGVPPLEDRLVQELLYATGNWPLLVRLTNRLIAEDITTGANPTDAARNALQRLHLSGPSALDPVEQLNLDDPKQRNRAVRATIEAGTQLLPHDGAALFAELGVFAEDEVIPVRLACLLWHKTGGLTETQSRELCRALGRLSLVSLDAADQGRLTLHDVIRDFLRGELGEVQLTATQGALVVAVEDTLPAAAPLGSRTQQPDAAWWELPSGYMQDHAIAHLVGAGRSDQAEAVASDIRWLEARVDQRGPLAAWLDLLQVQTSTAAARAQDIASVAHLLTPTAPARALNAILQSRLAGIDRWQDQLPTASGRLARPALINNWTPPDLPDQALRRTFSGHSSSIAAVAATHDGARLISVSRDKSVRIWNRSTGDLIDTRQEHTGWVRALAVAPDDSGFVTGSESGEVRWWDLHGQTPSAPVSGAGHIGGVTAIAISPDGAWFASAGYDKQVAVRKTDTLALVATLALENREVTALDFTADSKLLATGSADGEVRLWDWATGTTTARLKEEGHVYSLAVSAGDGWLAFGTSAGEVRTWDMKSGSSEVALERGSGPVYALAISAGGGWIAAGTAGGDLRLLDRAADLAITIPSHSDMISGVAISADGDWVVTAGQQDLRLWDVSACASPATSEPSWSRRVFAVAVSSDGTWIASSGDDNKIRIREKGSGAVIVTLVGHQRAVTSVSLSNDGTLIASADMGGQIRIWDRAREMTIANAEVYNGEPVSALTFSPDATRFVTITSHGAVELWDTATCTELKTGFTQTTIPLGGSAHAADGSWFATGGDDANVRLWDTETCAVTSTLSGHKDTVHALAIASDGTWLASGDAAGDVRVWDPESGTTTAVLSATGRPIHSMAISPDGRFIAVADSGGELRIWERASGQVTALMRADGALFACSWTPDGTAVAAAGEKGVYFFGFVTG
ncbi:NB-ARC domain-containing protein [Streptacidiphilus sp. EB129]|uniref:NB-ARC domain-containing protein n=1 Tax=Streptacidiphilus sp. EB129 TaxID=3156262 RepID=UPI0035115CC0